MPGIKDEAFKTQKLAEAEAIVSRAKAKCEEVLNTLDARDKK